MKPGYGREGCAAQKRSRPSRASFHGEISKNQSRQISVPRGPRPDTCGKFVSAICATASVVFRTFAAAVSGVASERCNEKRRISINGTELRESPIARPVALSECHAKRAFFRGGSGECTGLSHRLTAGRSGSRAAAFVGPGRIPRPGRMASRARGRGHRANEVYVTTEGNDAFQMGPSHKAAAPPRHRMPMRSARAGRVRGGGSAKGPDLGRVFFVCLGRRRGGRDVFREGREKIPDERGKLCPNEWEGETWSPCIVLSSAAPDPASGRRRVCGS